MPPERFDKFDSSKPELIVSAALCLMSSFSCQGGCPKLAHVIVRHLQILAERADVSEVLTATCANLADQWEAKLVELLPSGSVAQNPSNVLPFRRPAG
jgi:hypothetical protein